MSVDLNHTIVHSRDKRESAEFLARILGLEVGAEWGPFLPVATGNGVTLDFATADGPVSSEHYAFLVTDGEFDAVFDRIERAGITYYADPHRAQPGEINHRYGGRGLYFLDPSGHAMEVITRPYGSHPQ
ncbi:VOC family protein [Streptomyces sp. NPDC092296]|uniref:VOC family protein n=1 Tax=Streptomyces sp. NPDC092296 TaxID=3366012 RepID=UPI0037FDC63C